MTMTDVWTKTAEMKRKFFFGRKFYRVYVPVRSWSTTERRYTWSVVNYNNVWSIAEIAKSDILHSIEIMPDGSWNNDAVNLIILDAICRRAFDLTHEEGSAEKRYVPIEDVISNHLNGVYGNKDPRAEAKLEYFKEKQKIMERYIDTYVPKEAPFNGLFALVH